MKDKNFHTAINLLNKLNLDYWICHGTLLGIIRDNKLLDWDNDVDIAMLEHSFNKAKLIKVFLENGFKKKKKYFEGDGLLTFTKDKGKEIDINIYSLQKTFGEKKVFINWFIPKNFFFKVIDAVSYASEYKGKYYKLINKLCFLQKFFFKIKNILIKRKLFFFKIGYQHSYSFIDKKIKVKFENLKIQIPNKPEEYLKILYGKNWKVPKKNYVWYKDSPALFKQD